MTFTFKRSKLYCPVCESLEGVLYESDNGTYTLTCNHDRHLSITPPIMPFDYSHEHFALAITEEDMRELARLAHATETNEAA